MWILELKRLMLCLEKSPKNVMVRALWWNLFDIFLITLKEHFVCG